MEHIGISHLSMVLILKHEKKFSTEMDKSNAPIASLDKSYEPIVGEAILHLLKKKSPKIRKKFATYTLEHPEHIPKEFGFPTCHIKLLADLKLLKI